MPERYWNHNTAFHEEIVADATTRGGRVIDAGCGEGLLLKRLAGVCAEAVGIELDPATARRARDRLAGTAGARVLGANIMDSALAQELGLFQTVTCVAVLHHFPLQAGLERLAGLVAPGGRLVVVGLAANKSAWDWIISAASALPIRLASRWHHETPDIGVPVARPRESLAEIRRAAARLLPGARPRRRFYYRYTLTWDRSGPQV